MMIAGDLNQFGPTGGSRHQCQFPHGHFERLRQRLQSSFSGAPIYCRCLDGHHQGVLAIAPADLGAAGAWLNPDSESDSQTRLRTATTLPRMEASLPSIGS